MFESSVSPPRFPCLFSSSALFALFAAFTTSFLCCHHPALASSLRETAIVKAVRQVAPSVVNIRGEKHVSASGATVDDDNARRVNGMGTGVVIDPRGYIITNHHVVDGVREIQVTLDDGKRYIARLVARDPETDLAVIKIDCPRKLRVVKLGSSSDLMTGEPVIAVGNAFGYEHTVTRGIISSLHRAVQVSDAQYYADLIQTDASINPGNSGGALLNIDGDMIGVVVAVRAGAQGIGFAIPVNTVIEVATNLLSSRNESHTKHGLRIACSDERVHTANKLVSVSTAGKLQQCANSDVTSTDEGVIIAAVERQSPASQAGIKPGDVVTQIDGLRVRRGLDFERALLEKEPGERLAVTVQRGGKPVEVALTLSAAEAAQQNGDLGWEMLGLSLKKIDTQQFQQEFKTRYRGGLEITAVRPGSPAAAQGIKVGDILVGMHIWETVSLDNVSYILKRPEISQKGPVKFFILRGSDTLFGYMSLAMRDVTSR